MLALLYISFSIALAYLCLSVGMCGRIPVSLSATYYDLGSNGWLFSVCMGIVALTLTPVWIEWTREGCEWTAFLSGSSLLFVAAAPAFRVELEGKVHYGSAAVCCVCAVLWQILEGLWDVTLFFAFVGGMLSLQFKEKWCWWLECAVVGSVYANLFRLV